MNKRAIIFSILLVICLVILAILCVLNNKKFNIDSNDKYIFTTYLKYITLQNDGGSHTNQYYQVDLKNKIVNKCEDVYKGLKGYIYQGKVIKTVNLSEEDVVKIKEIFNEIIKNKENEKNISDTDYKFYTLTINENESIKVNDYYLINEFLKIVDNEMVINKN